MNPIERAVAIAIRFDAEDEERIVHEMSVKLQAREFYRRDRIINTASAAVCGHRGEFNAIRGCQVCREAVAKAYDAQCRAEGVRT